MIQHFENLQTPLKSIKKYPRLSAQEQRFKDAGWTSASARSLWDFWGDPSFLSVEQRLALNDIEPFDEWEEFALFATHYFLLEASSDSRYQSPTLDNTLLVGETHSDHTSQETLVREYRMQPGKSQVAIKHRRLGAVFEIAPGIIGIHGGLGDQSRLNSTAAYTLGEIPSEQGSLPPLEIESRMCHTITSFEDGKTLLVGGRASPDRGMSDCSIWLRQEQEWLKIESLPTPLYRHSATAVTTQQEEDATLIFGGKTNRSCISDSWFLWAQSTGWLRPDVSGAAPKPRFGASMATVGHNRGILVGDSLYPTSISAVTIRSYCSPLL